MSRLNALSPTSSVLPGPAPVRALGERPSFEQVYEEHFDFVWRSLRQLGVLEASLDDLTQEVFWVVHRKLDAFEGRSALKTWIFGIALRIAGDHRRALRRRSSSLPGAAHVDPDSLADAAVQGPHERLSRAESVRLLHALLDELDDAKRAVFVLAELEEMSVPEIAEATGDNVNTVYARLRAARIEFERALSRHRAREARRMLP